MNKSLSRPNPAHSLFIAGVTIHIDQEGRYCLTDLHKASGGKPDYAPGQWLRIQQTQELIAELSDVHFPTSDQINNLTPVKVVNSFTEKQGTFVVKELVYAYAMWISAAFMLQVIRTFDAAVNERLKDSMPAKAYLQLNERHSDLQEKYIALLEEKAAAPALASPHYRRPWSREEDAKAVELFQDGLSYRQIGAEIGRSMEAVSHRFRGVLKAETAVNTAVTAASVNANEVWC